MSDDRRRRFATRTRLLVIFAVAAGVLTWLPSDVSAARAHAESSSLEVLYDTSFAPGDFVWLNGETGWFRPTNCPNKPVATLTDSLGHSFNLGPVAFDQSETNSPPYVVAGFYGPVELPLGVAAGGAHITVRQKFEFKLPVIGCFELASKQATVSLTIDGAAGDNPPKLSSVHIPGVIVQRKSTTISWSLSKAATVDVSVGYQFNASKIFWLDLGSVPASAGAGSFAWNGTFQGQALPIGNYALRVGATDAANEQATPVSVEFGVEAP